MSSERVPDRGMKVMGSALFSLQAIVLGLAIPVAVVIYDVPKMRANTVVFSLMIMCIVAIGGMRHDRQTAIRTAIVVQSIIILCGFLVKPLFFPGILFALVWALAINLSGKIPPKTPLD